jgi:hypothetical protein
MHIVQKASIPNLIVRANPAQNLLELDSCPKQGRWTSHSNKKNTGDRPYIATRTT